MPDVFRDLKGVVDVDRSLRVDPAGRLSRSFIVFALMAVVGGIHCQLLSGQSLPPTLVPNIHLHSPQELPVSYTGSPNAVSALSSGQAVPLSLASGDFYQDGISSLAVGYTGAGGGIVSVRRGNADAFAPQSQQSWQAIGQGQPPSPFLSTATVFQTPVAPDFLATGEFAGTDHVDLVIGARGGGSLYLYPGDGQGNFATPQSLPLPGALTVLAGGSFGGLSRFTSLLVGTTGAQPWLLLYQGSTQRLSLVASLPLPAPAVAFAFGDLDGDSLPDAAIVSGGQVLILHAAPGAGTPSLEAVPLPYFAGAIALGSFVRDRGWREQMAILASDGSVHVLAHGGFDSHGWTQGELGAMRQATLWKRPNPFAPAPFIPVRDGWTEVEVFSGVAPFTDTAHPPLVYRARVSDQSADDIVVINRETAQMTLISHQNTPLGTTSFTYGVPFTPLNLTGVPVTAFPMRVSVDGRGGFVLLYQNDVVVKVMMPLAGSTLWVNRTDDPPPGITANNCNNNSCADPASSCSLRQAVIKANADASNQTGPDVIMVCPGTYALTIPSQNTFPGTAAEGHLDINGGVTIVGAGPAATIFSGQAGTATLDKVFSIGLTGDSFSTTFSNLSMQSGQAPAADPVGGAFDWDAGLVGTGSLTLTGVGIAHNSAIDNTIPGQDDGGGIFLSNMTPQPSIVTISGNSTIHDNLATDAGGGIAVIGPVSLELANSQIQSNRALGVGGQVGGGIALTLGTMPTSAQIHHSMIISNIAGNGGGIWTQQPMMIDRGTIIDSNNAGNAGGGLWGDVSSATLSMIASTITHNQASGDGGGIHIEGSSNTNLLFMAFNRIVNNAAPVGSALNNASNATVLASDNWWGCNAGPTVTSCNVAGGSGTFGPWITLTHVANPNPILIGTSTALTASFAQDSGGTALPASSLGALIGQPIAFNNVSNGSLSSVQTTIQGNGAATATYAAGSTGVQGRVDAVVDNAIATATVLLRDFSLSATPGSQARNLGTAANASYQVSVGAINGFGGTVQLSSTVSPNVSNGPTVTLSASSIVGSGSSTLSIGTSALTPAQTYTVTIQGASGSISHTATVNIVVADFSISISPTSQTESINGTPSPYTVTVSSSTGFSGPLNLSTNGLPSGTSAAFTGGVVNLSSSVTSATSGLTITAPSGIYNFTVQASSGSVTHAVNAQLTVTVPPPPPTATGGFTVLGVSATMQTVSILAPNTSQVLFTGTCSFPFTAPLSDVATGIASTLERSHLVTATSSGTTVNLTAVTAGAAGNYQITTSGFNGTGGGLSGGTN